MCHHLYHHMCHHMCNNTTVAPDDATTPVAAPVADVNGSWFRAVAQLQRSGEKVRGWVDVRWGVMGGWWVVGDGGGVRDERDWQDHIRKRRGENSTAIDYNSKAIEC